MSRLCPSPASASILGAREFKIKERWQGIYASSPRQPFLIEDPAPGVTAAIVTSGVGMTISFGLAEKTFAALRAALLLRYL